jgi:hypothetical protein
VEGADYDSVNLSSDAAGAVGEYGFNFSGSNLLNPDIRPRETCSCSLEFPKEVVNPDRRSQFAELVARVAELCPFESGFAGYAFKHAPEASWRNDALTWISQRAQRFLALDISYDGFERVARGRVVTASWITLLGVPVVAQLGGEAAIRAKLSAEIAIRPLKTGLMIVAGEHPPIGDVNRGATDVALLKEVAALTKPVRAQMEIGFGSEEFRHGWLNRFD